MAEEITCPACDTPNDALAQQCDACGAELHAPAAYEFEDAPAHEFTSDEISEGAAGEDDFSAGYGFAVEGAEDSDEDATFHLQGEADEDLYEIEYASDGEEDGLYELEVDTGDADADHAYLEDDVLAADGGMALAAVSEVDTPDAGGQTSDAEDDPLVDAALSEVSDAADAAQQDDALAPELAAILHPTRLEREPIAALPTPGRYAEPASLRVFHNGEQLGTLAIDAACTVLGRAATADDDAYELKPVDDDFPFAGELEEEPVFDLHELSEPEEDASAEFEHDAPSDFAAESSAATVAAEPSAQDPQDLEEGPVIDLSQYGDASKFATRHGYIFCQNKNYTLCVLSDMGTQLNDEMLELGARRTLTHGDVIIVGGEVALQFRSPAA